ncbi:hypothetical protein AB6A40_007037 [Gnathostoma spinigerum]|uniref:Uncharacterized protein n=1 Tax=Gnathostoma spinigerum TaxID=75299 RepID=A0ABD6EKC3_9BILA
MALPVGLGGSVNGSSEPASVVTPEMIDKALDSVQDPMQKSFIAACLNPDPTKRPTARELLFHTILFEVHSLKLLAAHRIVASKLNESLSEDDLRVNDKAVAAVSKFKEMAYCQVPAFQVDLEKFLEDVSNGIYPLTAFAPLAHQLKMTASSSSSPLNAEPSTAAEAEHSKEPSDHGDRTPSPASEQPLAADTENRSIVNVHVSINGSLLTVLIKLEDMMNRQLTTEISDSDTPESLATELVQFGLIAEADEKRVIKAFEDVLEEKQRQKLSMSKEGSTNSPTNSGVMTKKPTML